MQPCHETSQITPWGIKPLYFADIILPIRSFLHTLNMLRTLLPIVLVLCRIQSILARAVPGTRVSGRDYVDHVPSRKVRSLVPREEKIAPKVIITYLNGTLVHTQMLIVAV